MSQYNVIVKNKDNTTQWELPVQSGVIEWNLNNIHTCTLYIDFKILKDYLAKQNTTPKNLFEGGFMNAYIYRDNTLFFAGFLTDVIYQKYTQDFNVQLGIKSWLAYFENRYYTGQFINKDAGEIAWSCINAMNDIGITKGTIEQTKSRNKTYKLDDVAKIITHLSINEIQEGFDFDITNQKVFTVYSRLGSDRQNIIFDEYNITEYTLDVGLVGKVFNYGHILGGGTGDSQIIKTYDAGGSYVTAWYRQEALLQDVNVEDTTVLNDTVKKYIELRKNPIRILKFKALANNPSVTDYSIGDSIKIKLSDIEVDELRRIMKKSLYFGDNEYVTLEFL